MTLNVTTGATASTQAVNDQITRSNNGQTLLTPTQVAALLADAYHAYAKEGTLPGCDMTGGGTKSILDGGFISDNTSATVTSIAAAICNYWATNNTPGDPAHGGTSVVSVTIASAAAIPAMEAAITGYMTDQPGDGWLGFYNVTEPVVNSIVCTIVELIQPGNVPTPFVETIT